MCLLRFEFPQFCLSGFKFRLQDFKPCLNLLLHNFFTLKVAEIGERFLGRR